MIHTPATFVTLFLKSYLQCTFKRQFQWRCFQSILMARPATNKAMHTTMVVAIMSRIIQGSVSVGKGPHGGGNEDQD